MNSFLVFRHETKLLQSFIFPSNFRKSYYQFCSFIKYYRLNDKHDAPWNVRLWKKFTINQVIVFHSKKKGISYDKLLRLWKILKYKRNKRGFPICLAPDVDDMNLPLSAFKGFPQVIDYSDINRLIEEFFKLSHSRMVAFRLGGLCLQV